MRDAVDLSRYFARIGYRGPAQPTLDVLRELQLLHPQSIPFENLNPYTGARVALDLESVVDKLIERRRGGYCFEQNKLFYTVLVQLGFRVTPLIARVRWQRPPDVSTPQTHMLLRVDLDGATWFADVGFGSTTLTAPLRFDPNVAQSTPHGTFRVVDAPVAGELEIECETPAGWQPLYRFSLKPVEWVDYEVANWYTSRHPDSFFTHDLVVCRILPDARAAFQRCGDAADDGRRGANDPAAGCRRMGGVRARALRPRPERIRCGGALRAGGRARRRRARERRDDLNRRCRPDAGKLGRDAICRRRGPTQ